MKCPIDKENLSLSLLFSMFLKSQKYYFNYYLKDEEISIQHIPIITKLLDHDYIYQKDISRDLQIDNGYLTRNLRKLEDLGFIIREEDDDNRRQNKISLTDEGKNLAIKIKNEANRREETIIENTSISRDELINIFLEILENSKEFNNNSMGD